MLVLNTAARGSGSRLQQCVYKSGGDAVLQAHKMLAAPATFAPVLAVSAAGYVMPVLQVLGSMAEVDAALECLRTYWGSAGTAVGITRAAYQAYVATRAADQELLQLAEQWYRRTVNLPGLHVAQVHGDATIENAMLHQGRAVWIDPSVRPVPLDAELDCGKLLQSAYGYGENPVGTQATVLDFLARTRVDLQLAKYYLATHLVRLWPHQPERRAWALAVAREVLGADSRV